MSDYVLGVDYHQQDTDFYCGAASAQMVLQSIGAGLMDQMDLYADNHAHSLLDGKIWYTAPDGLAWTMNDRRPVGFETYFAWFGLSTEEQISRKIVWSIFNHNIAAIALVFGWNHWLPVVGYSATEDPTSSLDTSYAISAFTVNNPWPPSPLQGPPPPHVPGDDCGSGGDRGLIQEHIAYPFWQSTYMTGVPAGKLAGQYVAVCDPEPPPAEFGARLPRKERVRGKELLSPEAAVERAILGLREYGLYQQERWRTSLAQAEPGEPMLVQRLDRPNSFYYIVPMGPGGKELSVLVNVDARSGDYQQCAMLPKPGPNFLMQARQDKGLGFLRDRRIQLPSPLGEVVLESGTYSDYHAAVWKPCRESLSPNFPFHMITIGDHQVYIRSDGAVFTELHDSEPGI